jgi:hypothetical protein
MLQRSTMLVVKAVVPNLSNAEPSSNQKRSRCQEDRDSELYHELRKEIHCGLFNIVDQFVDRP